MSANSHIFPFHLANTKTPPTYNFFFLFSFHSSFFYSPLLSLTSFNFAIPFYSLVSNFLFYYASSFLFSAFETENYKLCTMATFFLHFIIFSLLQHTDCFNFQFKNFPLYFYEVEEIQTREGKKSSFRNSPMTLDEKERKKNSHPPIEKSAAETLRQAKETFQWTKLDEILKLLKLFTILNLSTLADFGIFTIIFSCFCHYCSPLGEQEPRFFSSAKEKRNFSFFLSTVSWLKTWDRFGTFCLSPKSRRNCVWKNWETNFFPFSPSNELLHVLVSFQGEKLSGKWRKIYSKSFAKFFLAKCSQFTHTAHASSRAERVLQWNEIWNYSQWKIFTREYSTMRIVREESKLAGHKKSI